VQRAIALFERALEIEPDYVDALIALGNALQMRGTFLAIPDLVARARSLVERALEIAPTRTDVHVRLGQILVVQGEIDAAEAAIRRGLALDPDSALAHSALARVLWVGRARIDEAIGHFTRAAALAPEAGYTYLQLALLQALNGDLGAAERNAKAAVELQQKAMSGAQGLIVVGAHTRLGYVHYLRGQYEDSIREYRRELSFLTLTDHALRDRSIIEVSQKLAASYHRLGTADEARTYGNAAIEAFDRRLAAGADDPFTRYYLAALHALRDDVEPVLRHLERPLRELGAFTRWRLTRDPDFAGVLANPAVAALLNA
jgi:tetratricopeptide (TPR) repeat protein